MMVHTSTNAWHTWSLNHLQQPYYLEASTKKFITKSSGDVVNHINHFMTKVFKSERETNVAIC